MTRSAAARPFPVYYSGTRIQLASDITPALSNPSGLAVDLAGNLYIADTGNSRIVKVSAAGTTSTFSLTGISALNSPHQVAVDSSGNLYIADTGNNRIVKSDPSGAAGVINTGSFTLNAPKGVAVDALGNLFIADSANNRMLKVTAGAAYLLNTTGGLTIDSSSLNSPVALATDTYNNLYIVDQNNNRVVEVSAGLVGFVVSTGSSLTSPTSVTVSDNGVIYIADGSSPARVTINDPQGDQYDLFFGERDNEFGAPAAIATDSRGAFYIADIQNNVVNLFHQGSADFGRVQSGSSGIPETLSFNISGADTLTGVSIYTAGAQNLDFTIAANSGTPCTTGSNGIACTVNVQFTPTAAGLRRGALVLSYEDDCLGAGTFTVPLFGIGDAPVAALSSGTATRLSTGILTFPQPFKPFQTATDGVGNIYATDTANNKVYKIPTGGGTATTVSIPALPSPAGLSGPTGIAIDGAGNLFIADAGNDRIVEIASDGAADVVNINSPFSGFNNPQSIFITGSGDLIVDDAGHNRIVDLSMDFSGTIGNTLATVNAFVLSTGAYTLTTGVAPSSPYNSPTSAAMDADGNLYISDDVNDRIVKIDRLGDSSLLDFSSLASALITPHSVALDPMGNLYVLDSGGVSGSQRVIQRFTNGTISAMSFSGSALGSTPNQIAVDAGGNVLVADYTPTALSNSLVQINVGQAALSFSAVQQGSSSAPQTVSVTNIGNQSLLFSANPTYTANFSQNMADANVCTSNKILSVGTSCDVSVRFTPQTTGALSANVNVTDNTQNLAGSTQQIAVSGTGTALVSSPSPPVYTPPTSSMSLTSSASSVAVGQTVSITAVLTPTGNLAGGASPTGTVQFFDESYSLGAVTLTAGKALVATSTLSAGTHRIAAVYSGDGIISANQASIVVIVSAVTLTTPTITLENAAGNSPANFAANEITSIYGITGLTGDTTATTPSYSLRGIAVTVTDSAGAARQALLFGVYASVKQINLLLPGGVATGTATVNVTLPGGGTRLATLNIAGTAPGIFTASANGQGVYAGQVIYQHSDGSQTIASPADPISLTGGNQVFLALYATGLRTASSLAATGNGVTVPVAYFGPQGGNNGYGLDQINLGPLPGSLVGGGTIQLVITVDGLAANTVMFSVR